MEVEIINYLKNETKEKGITINLDTNLFEEGLIDSLGFVRLVLFVEELRGSAIDANDMDISNFETIKSISNKFS
ncbi:phosphopantetheine attachment site [Vibrio sp. T187]|uniref:phosphopantetheine-binding protein n=1 Tax=Vibrio TaxID=662 RepID=UPI0010C9DCA6|nr:MULTISPECIES: phosphopantetheine-binding protein [Vibrio]MBW3696754.1 phosphopantetheine attachment site [Vibrio sp. T187]